MLEQLREARALEEDRHRLLGADDRDRDRPARRRASRSRRSRRDRSGAAGSARGTCLPVALRALGEHEHELLLVVQQPVRVVGVRGDAAAARPQRADDRHRAEQVLGQAVDRPAELGLDAVHDHRRVGRDRARVVRDEQRAALAGDVLEALPLDPEPVAGRSGRRRARASARRCSLRPQRSTSERRMASSVRRRVSTRPARQRHELAAPSSIGAARRSLGCCRRAAEVDGDHDGRRSGRRRTVDAASRNRVARRLQAGQARHDGTGTAPGDEPAVACDTGVPCRPGGRP